MAKSFGLSIAKFKHTLVNSRAGMHGRLFSQGQAAATELLRGELEKELSN